MRWDDEDGVLMYGMVCYLLFTSSNDSDYVKESFYITFYGTIQENQNTIQENQNSCYNQASQYVTGLNI